MNRMSKLMGLAVTALLVLPAASWGQSTGQQQGMGQQGSGMGSGTTQQQTPPPATNASKPDAAATAPPAVDPAQEQAFKKLTALDPSGQPAKPDELLKQTQAFLAKYNTDASKPSPFASRALYMEAAAYNQLDKTTEMFTALQQSLKIDPTNVNSLALYAMTYSRTIDTTKPSAAADEKSVEDAAENALTMLNRMTKPGDVTQEQFDATKNWEMAECYSGLGLVKLQRSDAQGAAADLQKATMLEKNGEPVDLYLYGTALSQSGQYAPAVTAFQACLKDPGGMEDRCKNGLDDAKKKAASAPKQ
jgi:hypothetical protein